MANSYSAVNAKKGLWIVPVIALVIGLAAGLVTSSFYLQPTVSSFELREDILESQIDRLESKLASSTEELSRVRTLIGSLDSNLARISKDKEELDEILKTVNSTLSVNVRKLESTENDLDSVLSELRQLKIVANESKRRLANFDYLISGLDSDRNILIELRKEVPEIREEAREFWSDLKLKVSSSDPKLAVKIDRILARLDQYFNWIELRPSAGTPQNDFCGWILSAPLGTFDYTDEIDTFEKEMLLVVITRIDATINLAST